MIELDRACRGAWNSMVTATSTLMLPVLRLLTLLGGILTACCLVLSVFAGGMTLYHPTSHNLNILILSFGGFAGFYCLNVVLHVVINKLYQITEYGPGV